MRVFLQILGICLFALSACAGPLAQFRTVLGEIDVELFDMDKPITVQNFTNYVQSGLYSGMFFHRWVPTFVIQGGGFHTIQRNQTNVVTDIATFGQITNEYSVGRIFSNTAGTLAMARAAGATNSATSQWFFNLTNNSFLDQVDGGFTVFGRTLSGMEVLDRFNQVSTNNGIFQLDLGAPLNELPVLVRTNASYNDLIYVDITLLNVHVREIENAQKEISWQSVSNKVNHVQYTVQVPPVWQELISTNGTGQLIQVVDSGGTNRNRFYRILVDY